MLKPFVKNVYEFFLTSRIDCNGVNFVTASNGSSAVILSMVCGHLYFSLVSQGLRMNSDLRSLRLTLTGLITGLKFSFTSLPNLTLCLFELWCGWEVGLFCFT